MTKEAITRLAVDAASLASETARSAIARFDWSSLDEDASVDLLREVTERLGEAGLVPNREQADRFRTIVHQLVQSGFGTYKAIEIAGRMPPHLKAVLADEMPASFRPMLYGRTAPVAVERPEAPAKRAALTHGASSRGETPSPASPIPLATAALGYPTTAECRTVLLFSAPGQQDANLNALTLAGLEPAVVESLSELNEALLRDSSICGCVVDRSALLALSKDEQEHLFRRLGGYSTFMRIRVESREENDGLKMPWNDVRRLVRNARLLNAPLPDGSLAFFPDRNISPAELSEFTSARETLRPHESTRFVVEELTPTRSHLLVAAARLRLRSDGDGGAAEVHTLTTRFLSGGRSGAVLATVRVNQLGPIVAKMTTKLQALDEGVRFRRFIRHWDSRLWSEVYFHGEDAVTLTGLIGHDIDPNEPAATVESQLSELWNDEWLGAAEPSELQRRAMFLASGLVGAAGRLATLNRQRAPDDDVSDVAPTVSHIGRLEAAGLDVGLGQKAIEARALAKERFHRLGRAAVVHGDVHLRNMVVRGGADIHFVDFAASGPGHPAEDLVRMELALYTGVVRQFESDEQCTEFQRVLTQGAPVEELRERFPAFFSCSVNLACAHGMVAARDRALDVLHDYGANHDDYCAVKCLIAWQHVGIVGMHTGLARAVVTALAPT